jgi:EAL domain-containing protein (putative c-di-GMP-specific phosphodiesterase class I)
MSKLFSRAGQSAGAPEHAVAPVAPVAAVAPVTSAAPEIRDVVARRLVRVEFQPIVHLATGEVVAYEALARGPAGTALESPARLFAAADEAGLTWELDTVAHTRAFQLALEANLHPSTSVFINAHPASVGRQIPPDLAPIVMRAYGRLRVLTDISEKAISADPSATLAAIERARAAGWGVSLDNVGLTADSLALMPFAHPDVVKIDVGLLHERAHPHAPRIMGAVTAHAARTGASTLATHIESDDQRLTARALGATFGQGYLFGRPGPLPPRPHTPANPIPLIGAMPPVSPGDTPFLLAGAERPALRATPIVLEALAADLEQRAVLDPDPPVVLAGLPQARLMSGGPLAFLQVVARSASFVGLLCAELLDAHPPAGVHLARLAPDDPLCQEWTMILLGPHYSALLTARIAGPDGELQYALAYDRALVVRAARVLLQRITG